MPKLLKIWRAYRVTEAGCKPQAPAWSPKKGGTYPTINLGGGTYPTINFDGNYRFFVVYI